ncbi:MAG TPA: alpha/beta hydrolase [Tetrasphaera sp.]|uniref:alpha/beta hydrolase n=1 Tax=Nostocoides sp. TaxID=1917966 RepID=UPI002D08EF95|nr:alpha/beta hydrolase [Tetrasphaera sp.]HNQ08138.1 alpha/beta hydrolase [Tetrasphaera sp.]
MDLRDLRPPVEDGPWPPITHFPPMTQRPFDGAQSWSGLSYALIDGYRPLVMDVHVPLGVAHAPVVVWVHGGGWATGDRRHTPLQWGQQRMFERLLGAGLAVATPDYRLTAEAALPAPVHDLTAAVRYLRHYATQLRLDTDRIGVWGDSAGAHLVTLAGLAGSAGIRDPWLLGEAGVAGERTDVRAIVYWYGASDLTVLPDLQAFLWPDADPDHRAELARRCSPVTYLRPDSPPLLVMHGDRDTMAPLDQAVRLKQAADAAGAACELVVVPGAEHVFLGAAIEPQWDHAIAFLTSQLT